MALLGTVYVPFVQAGKERLENNISAEEEGSDSSSSENELPKEKKIKKEKTLNEKIEEKQKKIHRLSKKKSEIQEDFEEGNEKNYIYFLQDARSHEAIKKIKSDPNYLNNPMARHALEMHEKRIEKTSCTLMKVFLVFWKVR